MKISDLRHRITIQQKQRISDGRGGWKGTWIDLKTVWAAVKSTTHLPKEQVDNQQVQTANTFRVTIRFSPGITADMRIIHQGKIYYIVGQPVDDDGRRRWLEIFCVERRE